MIKFCLKKRKSLFFPLFLILLLSSFFLILAESKKEIEYKIEQQDAEIKRLEKAIAESEKKVKKYAGQSVSLKKELANLNYLNSKLKKVIYQKEQEIKKLNKSLDDINKSISEKEKRVKDLKKKLSHNIFLLNQINNKSLFETLLAGKEISEVADEAGKIEKIQDIFKRNIEKISKILNELVSEKEKKEEKNKILDKEKDELFDKKTLLEKNKKDTAYLLKVTKNKEENFKKILAEQKKAKKEFEEELFKLESKLKFILDKNSVPPEQVGLFSWPTPPWPNKAHWVTQFFGLTTFREVYYNGKGHNGIDLGVPVGTPIYSVMDGVVFDTGDTTKVCRGVQYGKWITIDHGNGLTSMYAHLSLIKVKKGQRVKKGQKIALSGNTGYSTGPHLHFTVYYTKGVKIKIISHSYPGRCYQKKMKVPIAAHNAYGDPFKYLPKPEFIGLKPVKMGDKGRAVKELQNMLKYEKVFPRNISANGYFGSTTEKSLKRWKEKYNIRGDGKSFSVDDLKKFKEIY